MNLNFLLIIAVILLGLRLPSFMNKLGMSKRDKIAFVFMSFAILGLGWFVVYAMGMVI